MSNEELETLFPKIMDGGVSQARFIENFTPSFKDTTYCPTVTSILSYVLVNSRNFPLEKNISMHYIKRNFYIFTFIFHHIDGVSLSFMLNGRGNA